VGDSISGSVDYFNGHDDEAVVAMVVRCMAPVRTVTGTRKRRLRVVRAAWRGWVVGACCVYWTRT